MRTENTEPYTLFGNDGTDYHGGDLELSADNRLSVDIYSEDNLRGDMLDSFDFMFAVA